MKILIIGSGFLSQCIISQFMNRDVEVTVTTTTSSKIDTLEKQYDGVKVKLCSGENYEQIYDVVSNDSYDIIIVTVSPNKRKMGGLTFTDVFYNVFSNTYVDTTNNLVKIVNGLNKKPKIIYISAHSVYGDNSHDIQVTEEHIPVARHRCAEMLIEAEKNIMTSDNYCILRLGWLVGGARDWYSFIKMMSNRYEMPGNSLAKGNFVNVDDAVRSVLHVIDAELEGIYNVCNDAHPSWGELWNVVSDSLNISRMRWNIDLENKWFEGDHVISNEKLKSTGFTFMYPTDTGLIATLEKYGGKN